MTISAQHRRIRPAAFTIIEMLVVMVVILFLAGLIIGLGSYANRRLVETDARVDLQLLRNGLEEYRLDVGQYPPGDFTMCRHMDHTAAGVGTSRWRLATSNYSIGLRAFEANLISTNLSHALWVVPQRTAGKAPYLVMKDQWGKLWSDPNQAYVIKDPWGRPYNYRRIAPLEYELWSWGKEVTFYTLTTTDPVQSNLTYMITNPVYDDIR